jgi:hypothetical protein
MAVNGIFIPDRNNQIPERIYQIGEAFGIQQITAGIRSAFMPPDKGKDNKVERKSFLGTPVMSNLSIAADEYTTSSGQRVKFANLDFDCVLFEIRQIKNIIYTPIQGRDGTVKEYIGNGDFDITCKGVIAGANGRYPNKTNGTQSGDTLNVVENLLAVANCNQEITINSWYLTEIFGIFQIVITDFDLGQEEGMYGMQRFSFNAKSDSPFTIKLNA